MRTTVSIPEEAGFLVDPEGAAMGTGYADPNDDSALADVEEEAMAVLWAADPGNQGA